MLRTVGTDRDFSVFSPQKIIWGPIPHLGTTLETPFSPVSFGKSFMKIRRLSHILWRTEKKQKKTNKKTSVKHIRIRLIGGCVNKFCSTEVHSA